MAFYSSIMKVLTCFLLSPPSPWEKKIQEEDLSSPVLAPKLKDTPKEEPVETSSPAKPPASGSNRATPSTSKSSKAKRKANGDEPKSANGAPSKKVKTETVCHELNCDCVKFYLNLMNLRSWLLIIYSILE